mgnify:FL=1
MKTKNLFNNFAINVFAVVSVLASSQLIMADDNEVLLDQTGSSLTFTVIQQGDSNKLAGDTTQSTDLILVGNSMVVDVAQIGDGNELFGKWYLDQSGQALDFYFGGSTNVFDLNISSNGGVDADNGDILSSVTGDSNVFDFSIGHGDNAAAATSFNVDLSIVGDRNNFTDSFTNSNTWLGTGTDTDYTILCDNCGAGETISALDNTNATGTTTLAGVEINSATADWEVDITGSDNKFASQQLDGANHNLKLVLIGSNGTYQFIQTSDYSSLPNTIDLDINSEDATVSIIQQD